MCNWRWIETMNGHCTTWYGRISSSGSLRHFDGLLNKHPSMHWTRYTHMLGYWIQNNVNNNSIEGRTTTTTTTMTIMILTIVSRRANFWKMTSPMVCHIDWTLASNRRCMQHVIYRLLSLAFGYLKIQFLWLRNFRKLVSSCCLSMVHWHQLWPYAWDYSSVYDIYAHSREYTGILIPFVESRQLLCMHTFTVHCNSSTTNEFIGCVLQIVLATESFENSPAWKIKKLRWIYHLKNTKSS